MARWPSASHAGLGRLGGRAVLVQQRHGFPQVQNLMADARCSVAIDDALDPVIVEGVAEIRADAADRRRYLDAMNAKYQVAYGADFLDGVRNLCLRVSPVSVIGLLQQDFTGSPTRWSFSKE